jgi:hypothetical protein
MRHALTKTAALLALLVVPASANAQQKNEGMGLLATPSQSEAAGSQHSNPAGGLPGLEEMKRREEERRLAEEMRRQRQLAEEQRRRQMEAEAAAKRQPK